MVEYSFQDQEQNRVEQEKRGCPEIILKNEFCNIYQGICFHDIDNICYKVRPRTTDEFMEWMCDLCSDCNEAVCNDCDIYREYQAN